MICVKVLGGSGDESWMSSSSSSFSSRLITMAGWVFFLGGEKRVEETLWGVARDRIPREELGASLLFLEETAEGEKRTPLLFFLGPKLKGLAAGSDIQ